MPNETLVPEIARVVCNNFIEHHRATSRRELVVQFEVTHLLSEMESRGFLKTNSERSEYLPSAGAFAVLPTEEALYLKAEHAFTSTVSFLRQLFLSNGSNTQYEFDALESKAAEGNPPLNSEALNLGLYLSQDFGVLSTCGSSDDHLQIVRCSVSEHVINLKDSSGAWLDRVRSAHEAFTRRTVPIEMLQAAGFDDLPDESDDFEGEASTRDLWSLLHPSIVPEAEKRFRSGLYADSVLAALKTINILIKQRTGLELDGTQLMTKAFAPNQPRLRFNSADSETARNLQQGYLQIFAGTMMAVRNPKAHGFEDIDEKRCIHFLFLASLLVYKLEEAEDVQQGDLSLPLIPS